MMPHRSFSWLLVILMLGATSAGEVLAVQSVQITTINGVSVPPDQVWVPFSTDQVFDIEWQAVDTDCNDAGVQEMEVLVDNKSQPSILGSGLSGTVTLDQAFFPSADCLHTIEIRARFLKKTVLPPSCLSLADPVLSGPSQIWSTSYSECTGPVDCNKSTVGLPIDVATGKMYYEMADLVIRGPLPIELVRRYDSQSTFNGPLGFGWSHNYLMRLEFPAAGGLSSWMDRVERSTSLSEPAARGLRTRPNISSSRSPARRPGA